MLEKRIKYRPVISIEEILRKYPINHVDSLRLYDQPNMLFISIVKGRLNIYCKKGMVVHELMHFLLADEEDLTKINLGMNYFKHNKGIYCNGLPASPVGPEKKHFDTEQDVVLSSFLIDDDVKVHLCLGNLNIDISASVALERGAITREEQDDYKKTLTDYFVDEINNRPRFTKEWLEETLENRFSLVEEHYR